MPTTVKRRALGLVLLTLLLSNDGCTVLGYAIGHTVDARAPELDTLSVAQLKRRPAGTPIALLLRDGRRVAGELESVTLRSPRVTHQVLAETLPADIRLPLPGETLQVTTAIGISEVEFVRVAQSGERHWIADQGATVRSERPIALLSSGAGTMPTAVPFDQITQIDWSDGGRVRGQELARALLQAGPADPRAVVLLGATGALDSVAAGAMLGVEARRSKHATSRGVLIGLGLDVTVYLWFRAWANALAASM